MDLPTIKCTVRASLWLCLGSSLPRQWKSTWALLPLILSSKMLDSILCVEDTQASSNMADNWMALNTKFMVRCQLTTTKVSRWTIQQKFRNLLYQEITMNYFFSLQKWARAFKDTSFHDHISTNNFYKGPQQGLEKGGNDAEYALNVLVMLLLSWQT